MNKDFIYEEQKQLIEMWKNKYYEQKEKAEQLEKTIQIKDEGIKAFTQDLCETTEKLEQLETNRDKAIEICDFYNKKYQKDPLGKQKVLFVISNVMNVLKGGSDE